VLALLIRHPWIDQILKGKKTWEIRGSRTWVRGQIGLIASRSGTVIGVCDLVDCLGPLTTREYRKNAKKAGMSPKAATLGHYRKTFAWVVKNPRNLKRPVKYQHPSGAVIWVRLEPAVEKKIRAQL
jgi:ASCH domain